MKTSARGFAVAAAALLAACAHKGPPPAPGQVIPSLAGAAHVYTLTNLHPDDERMVLYTANFQQPGLIPVCSEITFLRSAEDWMTFRVVANGKEYEYDSHQASAEPFVENLERYFGAECPAAKFEVLTPKERDAIRMGVVIEGMRKEAVVLAIGYPPHRDTPALERPVWKYWSSRLRSFLIEFDDAGVVRKIDY